MPLDPHRRTSHAQKHGLYPRDMNHIDLNDEWEVGYWCDRFGCTEMALRRALDAAGPTTAAVELKLKEAARESLQNTGES